MTPRSLRSAARALVALAFALYALPAFAADTPTALRVTVLNIDCSSSVGTASVTINVGGTAVGTFPFSQGCTCNSAPMTVTLNDPTTLAAIGAPACTDITAVINDPQGGAYVGYVKAEIDRTTSGTESICLQDYNGFVDHGGNCTNRDICTGYAFSPGTINTVLPDSDGDGSPNCTDTDNDNDGVLNTADNCPFIANATQIDSNGDGVGDACEPNVIAVPWLGVPTQPHQVYSGGQLVLQGTAKLDSSWTITAASWDPGDGSAAIALAGPFNPRALETTHVYTGSDGTPYDAILSVTATNGTLTKTTSDVFRVVVRTKTLDVEANMAIDKGLWYLHKQQGSGGNWQTGAALAATASAVQAFEINGHRETGNTSEDPYVDDVSGGLRYLFTHLAPVNVTVQTAGDPDTNGNGIGLTSLDAGTTPESYILGQVLDAIVASGTPTAIAPVGDATYVAGRSYKDIVQDIMDAYNWGQADPAHGIARGGWWYDLNSGSDSSAAQWGAIAGLAAQVWGVPVPSFVKTENALWVDQSSFFDGSNAGIDGRFDYDGGNGSGSIFSQSAAEAPSGLVQMVFDGLSSSNAQFKSTERYISRLFYSSNVWKNENHIYGMYAMAKAFRLASPAVTTLDAAGNATPLPNFDWYRSEEVGGAPMGVARILINSQQASGRWDASQWVNDHLATAWGVIILSPTIFQLGPTAVCDVEPSTTGVGGPVSFDASGSFHNDPGGSIASYSWAFQDGNSASGQTASHAFGATGTYNVVLTVTDTNGLTDTETCPVNIVAGAIPPNSNPGGPYMFCLDRPDLSLTLDGSASADSDGSIVSYDWDYTVPLNFTPADGTGVTVNATAAFNALAPGTYNVALRVTDNNGIQDTDFTTVTVFSKATCPIPPANTPPTVTVPSNITVEATSAAGAAVTFTATGNDAEDGALTPDCMTASGTTFPLGTTTVSCAVTDNGGLSASATFTITVQDTVAPTITAAGSTNEATSAAGAIASYTVSATDTVDPSVTISCDVPSGSTFAIGATTVHCTATDDSGNSSSTTATVVVQDTIAPAFTVSDLSASTVDPAGAVVTWALTATDAVDGTDAVVCAPPSGTTFPLGTTTVTCTSTDAHSNMSSHSFTVTVTSSNSAPVCTAARPSISEIWPPNHKLVPVSVLGVTDPNGDAVTIAVTGIFQDEPTNTVGDGNTPSDAAGIGTAVAQVRSERAGTPKVPGNGRVYHIKFTATDTHNASCSGEVRVGVPHDQGNKKTLIDDGIKYNSVTGAIVP